MTVAPLLATRGPAPLPLAIAFLLLAACSGGGEGKGPARRGAAGGGTEMESAGEVVIEAPRARYTAAPIASPGSVSGTVTLPDAVPDEPPVPAGRDSLVCRAAIADTAARHAGGALANAVVWLDDVRTGKPLSLEKRIELESDRCLLTPRVQAALVGGAVNVIGHDNFRQHLRFMAGGEDAPRAVVLLGKDEQVIPTELPLKAPGLVVVRDSDHPWPRAWVAVFDHPYFAVTGRDGSYTIGQVPPGTYTLVTWHERTGRTEQKVTVGAGAGVKVDVTVKRKA